MKSISTSRKSLWLDRCLLLGLAAIFGYSGAIKTYDAGAFSHVIARFDVLAHALVTFAAMSLPVAEIVLALALMLPVFQRPALLGVLLFCLMFAAVLVSAIFRDIPVNCGCFGSHEAPTANAAWWALGRDSVLMGVSGFLYARRLRKADA